MKWIAAFLLSLTAASINAMEINPDPRFIISFMDKALSPELDILRVTSEISPDNNLIFGITTRGERLDGLHDDYLLLQILHEKNYILIIPINKKTKDNVLIYESPLDPENYDLPKIFEYSQKNNLNTDFKAKRVTRGIDFAIPLTWINFGAALSFDAYTVQASIQGNHLQIHKIYDQARKGHNEKKLFSPITMLNKLCSPKR